MKRAPVRLAALMFAAAGLALPFAAAQAADPATAASAAPESRTAPDFAARLAAIDSLRDALRRDTEVAGGNADEVLARVQAGTDEARALAAAGETDVARGLLDEAYKLLAGTIARTKRGVVPVHEPGSVDPQAATAKARTDFARELASSRALLDAYRRLDSDRANASNIERLGGELDGAEKMAQAGDLTGAGGRLHEAYAQIKTGVTKLGHLESASIPSGATSQPTPAELRLRGERKIVESRALLDAFKRLGTTPAARKLAADLETQLNQADARRADDPQVALDQAEDAYTRVKIGLQSLHAPAPAGDKARAKGRDQAAGTGDRAAPAGGSSAETTRATEFANRLQSVRLLRATLVRLSKERKVDNAPVLAKADRLTGEAQRLSRDSLPLALAAIDEAYAVVKQAVISTQAR